MLTDNWCMRLHVCGWLTLWAASAAGGDWPQWGGSSARCMASPETRLPAAFEPGKKRADGSGIDPATTRNVRWAVKLGTENYSSPVVAQGRVLIGTNDAGLSDPRLQTTEGGRLWCFDEATGRLLWQLVAPKLEVDRGKVSGDFDAMDLGICGTATIADDRVYVVTNRCEALCLDLAGMANGNDGPFQDEGQFCVSAGRPPAEPGPRDADILWRFDMLRELPVFPHDATNCAPLVHGDYVYVGTGNGVSDGKIILPKAASLIALDKRTGRLAARDDEQISSAVFHGQWSSPSLAVAAGQAMVVYGGGDGVCHGFAPLADGAAAGPVATLKRLWSFDANPPDYRFRDGQPINYWSGDRRKSGANRNDGQYVGPSEIIGTPVFAEGRVYVAIGQDPLHGRGRGALWCIDPKRRGDISRSGCVWSYTGIERSLSTVAVAGGLVFAPDFSGKLHCLDAATGQVCWVEDLRSEIWSSPLVADGKVYLGTRKGLCVLAAARQARRLAEVRLGSPVWSAPAAANGTLFVASQKYLWAVCEKREMPPATP